MSKRIVTLAGATALLVACGTPTGPTGPTTQELAPSFSVEAAAQPAPVPGEPRCHGLVTSRVARRAGGIGRLAREEFSVRDIQAEIAATCAAP
jgi:hypothetical protein